MKLTPWKIFHSWAPPIALMATIFFLSSQQSIGISDKFTVNFLFFKSLHVIEYAVLSFLLARALILTTAMKLKHILIVASLGALLYGISDEIHQTFVPTRSGRLRDVFIDALGISLMYYFFPTVKRFYTNFTGEKL